jgi:hypothetical protein
VRIVEQSDDSKSASKIPPSGGDDCGIKWVSTSQNIASGSTATTLSSSGGNGTLDSSGYFPEGQSYMPEIPEFLDDFAGTDTWALGDENMPTGLFDTLMDMGPNTWSGSG